MDWKEAVNKSAVGEATRKEWASRNITVNHRGEAWLWNRFATCREMIPAEEWFGFTDWQPVQPISESMTITEYMAPADPNKLPEPTEQHSKFALRTMLDNLSPRQRQEYDAGGSFFVKLGGEVYEVVNKDRKPKPGPFRGDLNMARHEMDEILHSPRFSNGLKRALAIGMAELRKVELEQMEMEMNARRSMGVNDITPKRKA